MSGCVGRVNKALRDDSSDAITYNCAACTGLNSRHGHGRACYGRTARGGNPPSDNPARSRTLRPFILITRGQSTHHDEAHYSHKFSQGVSAIQWYAPRGWLMEYTFTTSFTTSGVFCSASDPRPRPIGGIPCASIVALPPHPASRSQFTRFSSLPNNSPALSLAPRSSASLSKMVPRIAAFASLVALK